MTIRPLEPITCSNETPLSETAESILDFMYDWGYHRSTKDGKYALRVPPTRQEPDQPRMDICSVKDVRTFLQYLRRSNGVDSMVHPPKFSYFGHHLINKNGIGRFRKQF